MIPITLTVPAAGTQPGVATYQGNGKYFLLTAISSGTISVVTNLGDEYDFSESNSGFGEDSSKPFGRLSFYNATGTAITITFYVTNTPVKLPDANITSSVTVNSQLTNTLASCAAAVNADLAVVTAAANTAKAVAAVSTPFRKCTILAYNAFGTPGNAPAANAGQVFVGVTANHQPIPLNPGDVWTFEAPTGAKYDLNSFYISAPNAGDGVLVIYS